MKYNKTIDYNKVRNELVNNEEEKKSNPRTSVYITGLMILFGIVMSILNSFYLTN